MKAYEINTLFYTLMDDVIASTEVWDQRDDDFSRRLYVRTVFAAMEGIVQVMKHGAQLLNELNDHSLLTPEETMLLREKDFRLDNSGNVRTSKRKISLLPNFEFTVKINAKVMGKTVSLDKSGNGWQSLISAIRIRDRLTHPKHPEDLDLTLDDMSVVGDAMHFFRESTSAILLNDE